MQNVHGATPGGQDGPDQQLQAVIAAAIARYLADEHPSQAPGSAWGRAALPDDRSAGHPWNTGPRTWAHAERPR